MQAILASIELTAPLAVTSTLDAPEGLFMTTSPVGLSVSWHADQPIDARDVRVLNAWPTFRTIVASIPLSTGASVSLMAPGGGASLVLGTCDGTLDDGTANGQALVDALRSELSLAADAIAAGQCTPDL